MAAPSRNPGKSGPGTAVTGPRYSGRFGPDPQHSAAPGQPQQWTFLDFAAEEADAERLSEQLAAYLARDA
ncbi:hypothetical protein AB0I00_32270 [Streptomyces sp. NPDC050803]|uniref:hypothetical protein n=1 Tax=unclassified Streptomyces TaxID=2593676 RepID=UPI003447DE2D